MGRKILFYDNFNDMVLNPTRWNVDNYGDGSTPLKKRYTHRPENLCIEDGVLVMTARRENYKGGEYTSACISTYNKFSFCYGRVEMRAKLPYGEGIWPALWMLGDAYDDEKDEESWPRCGEIDIVQMIGIGDDKARNDTVGIPAHGLSVYTENKIANNRSTGNLHWGVDRMHHESCGADYCLPAGIFADDYHIFAIEWTKEKIVWFVDDHPFHEVDINQPSMIETFHKPHWLVLCLNLVEGWEPAIKDITPFPQIMYVDYIKVLSLEED